MAFPFRPSPLLLATFLVASTGLRAADEPNYETQIRPILKEHCTHCHGEEEKLKGGIDLRLRQQNKHNSNIYQQIYSSYRPPLTI